MKASFVSHLEITDLECGDCQEKRINQAAPNQMSSFPQSLTVWGAMAAGGVGRLCFLKSNINAEVYQKVFEYFMLPAGGEIFLDAPISYFSKTWRQLSARSTMRWLEFTRPQSNRGFMGTGEKENVEGATKHLRGTQRYHSKSVELCHT